MGFKRRFQRKINKMQKHLKYANPVTAYKSASENISKQLGNYKGDDSDPRADAAQKVLKDQQRQAGGGQVRFTAETYE